MSESQKRERRKREKRERKERKEREKSEKLARMMAKRVEDERELYEPKQLLNKGYLLENLGELGSGTHCTVYRIKRHRANGDEYCAAKLIELDKLSDTLYRDRQLHRQIVILKQLASRHEHLVQVWDVFETSKRVFMMMECMEGGNLFEYLQSHPHVSDTQVCSWMFGLGRAINYLHTNCLAHRTIRLENLLLTVTLKLKLGGFSYARLSIDPTTRSSIRSETNCGGGPYTPMEVLSGDPYDPRAMDMWCTGVTIFYAINRRYPFDYKELRVQFDQQSKQHWKKTWRDKNTGDAHNLVSQLLIMPKTRITIKEYLNHRWFTKLENNTIEARRELEDIREPLLKAFAERLDIVASCISSIASSKLE